MKKYLILLVLLFPMVLMAQLGGRSVYNFLRLVPQARLAALGGENITTRDQDQNFGWSNPALVNDSMHQHLGFSFVKGLGNIKYGYASYAHSFEKIGDFHAGVQFVNYGKMTRADEYGNQMGSFSANDVALVVGGSRKIYQFRLGVNLKFINSNIAGFNSFSALAFDFGAMYETQDQLLQVSMLFKNIGGQLQKYTKTGSREPLPFETLLGVSYRFKHLPMRLSVTATNLQSPKLIYVDPNPEVEYDLTGEVIKQNKRIGDNIFSHFVFATEFLIGKRIQLRAGYNHLRRAELRLENKAGLSGFSFGLGLQVLKMNLDYGYAHYHVIGGTHSISISTAIGRWKKSKKE